MTLKQKMVAIAAVVLWLAWVALAFAQTTHDRFHYVYEGWLTAVGGSCCNDQDCAPTEGHWRVGPGGYEIQAGETWLQVPAEAVRPYVSPDGDAHACVWNGKVLCFVKGSGV